LTTQAFWWMASECLLNLPLQISQITIDGGGILPHLPYE